MVVTAIVNNFAFPIFLRLPLLLPPSLRHSAPCRHPRTGLLAAAATDPHFLLYLYTPVFLIVCKVVIGGIVHGAKHERASQYSTVSRRSDWRSSRSEWCQPGETFTGVQEASEARHKPRNLHKVMVLWGWDERRRPSSSNCHHCNFPRWRCCKCDDFRLTVDCGALWREDAMRWRHDKGCRCGVATAPKVARWEGKGVAVDVVDSVEDLEQAWRTQKHELRVMVKEHGGRGNTVHRFESTLSNIVGQQKELIKNIQGEYRQSTIK